MLCEVILDSPDPVGVNRRSPNSADRQRVDQEADGSLAPYCRCGRFASPNANPPTEFAHLSVLKDSAPR